MPSWLGGRDDLMLEVGAVGELLVARIRLVVVALIALFPPLAWWAGADAHEVLVGGVFATLSLGFSFLLLALVRRHGRIVGLRFLTAAFDVSSISIVLGLFLWQGRPELAVNSRVVFEIYLVAIAATALRGDPRVCVFAGGLALFQYAAIVVLAMAAPTDPEAALQYGRISAGDQVSRLILLAVATLVALACVRQTGKLLLMSSVDRMTGARNRAYLDSRLEREIRECRLAGRPLTVAMIDVDRFKPFNDLHGHPAGDAALREIAARLAAGLPAGAFLARYGGEEFTAVLPGLDEAAAQDLLDRLRGEMRRSPLELPGADAPVATPSVSIGVAQRRRDESAGELVERADRCLIRAKREGRDRVVAAGGDAFRTRR
ncbi:MAG: GGDEF domain-containing protein [Wenzhouxiangellaceae bacterium]|nr:GGDEF domain-containing protein [Wenzhouxiangellaceae bacterium]